MESKEEIMAIALALLNHFGISRTDVLSQRDSNLDYSSLRSLIDRLNKNEPLQYVLNEAWFCGHKFFVNPSVLIPRQETEWLVEEASQFMSTKKELSILDIGTGSGCIAISLALRFPDVEVWALDVSEEALAITKKNADHLGASVNLVKQNILEGFSSQGKFDLIVSNPPYVSMKEKNSLPKNVIDYEPHLALFADVHDPLIFYRAIAVVASQILKRGGELMVEINEQFGAEVESIFINAGLIGNKIYKDLSGKNRIVSASRSLN
jgi:release factor glutamine methyltransferase